MRVLGRTRTCWLIGGGALLLDAAALAVRYDMTPLVVTSPRQWRERIGPAGEVFGACVRAARLPFVLVEDINTAARVWRRITPETLAISFGAAWKFRAPLIARFGGRLLNFHAAPLPGYRGGGGCSWQMLAGDRRGACVLHLVTEQLDAGAIAAVRHFRYPAACRTPQDYQQRQRREGLTLLRSFLALVRRQGTLTMRSQSEQQSYYWPRLSTLDQGFVNWAWTARDIARFIAAFDRPHPGASTFLRQQRVFLGHGTVVSGRGHRFHPFQAGLVYRKQRGRIFVAAVGGTVVIERVCGPKAQDWRDRVRLGDRLYTPSAYLERAQQGRARYSPRALVPFGDRPAPARR